MDNFNIGELNFDELNTEITELTKKLNTLSRGTEEYKNTLTQLGKVMAEQKQRQKDLNNEVKSNVEQNISLRTQIRHLRTELENTDSSTEHYKEVFVELTDKMREQKLMSEKLRASAGSLQNVFSNTLKTASSLSGGFTALSGVMTLFGGDSEKVAQTLQKLMALMAITTGLQQFSKLGKYVDLLKISVVGMYDKWKQKAIEQVVANKTLTKSVEEGTVATNTNTVATEAGVKAYKESEVASAMCARGIKAIGKAIKSVAILAIISAVVEGVMKLIDAIKKHNEEVQKMKPVLNSAFIAEKEYNNEMRSSANSYEKNIVEVKNLQNVYRQYITAGKNKIEVLKMLKPALEKATGATFNLKQEEMALTDPKYVRAFVNAELSKAKSLALVNTLAKQSIHLDDLTAWLNYYQNLEIEFKKNHKNWKKMSTDYSNMYWNPEWANIQANLKKYRKEVNDSQNTVTTYTNRLSAETKVMLNNNDVLDSYSTTSSKADKSTKSHTESIKEQDDSLKKYNDSIKSLKESLSDYYNNTIKESNDNIKRLDYQQERMQEDVEKEKQLYEDKKITFIDYSNKMIFLYQKMYDNQNAIIDNNIKKEIEKENTSYNKQVNDINDLFRKAQGSSDYKGLSQNQQDVITKNHNDTLEKLQQKHNDVIVEIENKGNKERLENQKDYEKKRLENKKESDKKYLEEVEQSITYEEKIYQKKVLENKKILDDTLKEIEDERNNYNIFDIIFGDFGNDSYTQKMEKIKAELDNLINNKNSLESEKTILQNQYNTMGDDQIEAKQKVADKIAEIDEKITENNKAQLDKRNENESTHANMVMNMYNRINDVVNNSLSAIASNNEASLAETQKRLKEELDAGQITKDEYDKKNLKAQQKTNEKNKKYEAGLAMIQGIEGSVAVMTQSIKAYPAPYGAIIGGVSAAAVMASTIASIRKIYAQQVSDSSSNGVSGNASDSVSSPLIYSTQLTSSSQQQQINQQQQAQKVYVVESDITDAQRRVQVIQTDNKF